MKLVKIILLFTILSFFPIASAETVEEIVITDADSVWTSGLTPAPVDVIDATDAPVQNLIKYAFVSHADSVWHSELNPPPQDVLDSTDAPEKNLIKWAFVSHADSVLNIGLEAGEWEVKPDFWIDEIKSVQVIWDSDINGDGKIDLVSGKSTMIRVYVGMENYEALDKQQIVEVQLRFDGINYTESRTIGQLEQNNQIEFYPASPMTTGDQSIIAKVDPENKIEESNEINNTTSTEVTVKDTNNLYLIYFPVDRPITYFGYGPIDIGEYSETVSQSGKFISATYPTAEGEFINEKSDWKYYGDPIKYLGMIDDAISIWTIGELVTKTRANVSIGIVPEDYFSYHLLGETKGISLILPGINGVLAEEGYWTAAAHEVGHRFGLRLDEEEYVTNPPGNRADGFWVGERKEISNGVCFMGKAGADHSFSHTIKYDNRLIWIDNEDYEQLFKKFRVDKTDPDVLLMSGIISKDGTIQFGKLYMVENGTIDYIIPGDYSIQILDTDGQVLINIPFYTSFKMYINPFGIIDTDFAGFTLTIPYPEATSKIQIQYKEETLIEINPNTKLLHDAVDSVPDRGFINNPDQRRNALYNKIEAVEKMIEQNDLKGAVNKLKFDIKDKFEKWLVDDYQKENPEQLSKVEVIGLIQAIINRLSNQ